MKSTILCFILIASTMLLISCSNRAPAVPTLAESDTEGPAICQETRLIAEGALGRRATVAEVPFQDPIAGRSVNACQATMTGTGADFRSPDEIVQKLRTALASRGWREDTGYTADGPTSTGTGMVSGGRLCLLTAGGKPSDDHPCPADRPILECDVAPEQQLYTITLTCTQ
ncbi:MAG: hypothetical protein N2508_14935 [Anaerolineae bacterium]|nr:hypothetical protein [Anaerolineae bacterium]